MRSVGGCRRFRSFCLALCVLMAAGILAGGCKPKMSSEEIRSQVLAVIGQVEKERKLDDRETIYQIDATVDKRTVTLTGRVSDGSLMDAVLSGIKDMVGVTVRNDVEILPSKDLGKKTFAIGVVPVINLGDAPGQAEGSHTVTQAKIGDVFELLELKDGWYRARMEDRYLGWVNSKDIMTMDKADCEEYLSGKMALIIDKMTTAYKSLPSKEAFQRKIVQGTVLPLVRYEGKWAVLGLPEGDKVYVSKDAVKEFASRELVFKEKKGAQDIIATAKQYLGLPYLWGGTSAYGFDCSGFTQFCFKMNGYFLPRDADMQYTQGDPVDKANLQPGDLVFFQTYKEGPSHVGIYIGDSRFIHAGSSSGVAINSFNRSHQDYSATLDQKYLGARRIIK